MQDFTSPSPIEPENGICKIRLGGGFTIRQAREPEWTERAYFALHHRVPLDDIFKSTLTPVILYLAEHADELEVELVSSNGNKC